MRSSGMAIIALLACSVSVFMALTSELEALFWALSVIAFGAFLLWVMETYWGCYRNSR